MISSILAALTAVALGQTVNRTNTNGWGSTPYQRHYVNHTQALQIIQAGISRALAIKSVSSTDMSSTQISRLTLWISVPQNIAVLDPSAHLVAFVHVGTSSRCCEIVPFINIIYTIGATSTASLFSSHTLTFL
jgi:hypothetical protein